MAMHNSDPKPVIIIMCCYYFSSDLGYVDYAFSMNDFEMIAEV